MDVLLITKNKFGEGSDELGEILLKSYLGTLVDNNNFSTIILVNSGVKIACEYSSILSDLELISKDSKILLCQTCLNYYELDDKVVVGDKSNMLEISSMIAQAKKVVTI